VRFAQTLTGERLCGSRIRQLSDPGQFDKLENQLTHLGLIRSLNQATYLRTAPRAALSQSNEDHDVGGRWPSRLVATAAEDPLNISPINWCDAFN
jgi:hypothetical protein